MHRVQSRPSPFELYTEVLVNGQSSEFLAVLCSAVERRAVSSYAKDGNSRNDKRELKGVILCATLSVHLHVPIRTHVRRRGNQNCSRRRRCSPIGISVFDQRLVRWHSGWNGTGPQWSTCESWTVQVNPRSWEVSRHPPWLLQA